MPTSIPVILSVAVIRSTCLVSGPFSSVFSKAGKALTFFVRRVVTGMARRPGPNGEPPAKRKAEPNAEPPARRIPIKFQLAKSVPKGFLKSYQHFYGDGFIDVLHTLSHSDPSINRLLEDEVQYHQYKANLVIRVHMTKDNPLTGETVCASAYFRSNPITVLNVYDIPDLLNMAYSEIQTNADKWIREGSGWRISAVHSLHVDIAKYKPLKGTSYFPLPPYLKNKKALINVKNNDFQCLR